MSTSILVVDDNSDYCAMICDMLHILGYPTLAAHNGAEAIEVAADQHPRLIILDLVMPVMDGFSALSRLHADPQTSDIPVLILSSAADRLKEWQPPRNVIGLATKGMFSFSELNFYLSKVGNVAH